MKFTSLPLVTGIAVSGIVATGVFTPAHAATLLTSEVGYTGLRINLETPTYRTGTNNYAYTDGSDPTRINTIEYSNALKNNTITFTTTNPGGSTLGQNEPGFDYSLGSNGRVSERPVFAGLDQSKDTPLSFMSFNFATPVQQFGAYLNYAPFTVGLNAPVISTYNGTTLLSSFNLETDGGKISTPGQTDVFIFRGISESDGAVITSFRLSGANIVAAGQAYNLPASTAVPEPFTIIGTLVGGSAALRMRKKLKATKV